MENFGRKGSMVEMQKWLFQKSCPNFLLWMCSDDHWRSEASGPIPTKAEYKVGRHWGNLSSLVPAFGNIPSQCVMKRRNVEESLTKKSRREKPGYFVLPQICHRWYIPSGISRPVLLKNYYNVLRQCLAVSQSFCLIHWDYKSMSLQLTFRTDQDPNSGLPCGLSLCNSSVYQHRTLWLNLSPCACVFSEHLVHWLWPS